MINIFRKKVALYGCLLGIALSVIPLFCMVLKADNGSGAIITIDATSKDVSAIQQCIANINEDMVKQEVGNAGSGTMINGSFVMDTETAEAIHLEVVGTVCNISINNKVYNSLNMTDKQRFMKIALNDVQNSSISVINRNKIYTFIADSDTKVSGLVRQLSEDVTVDLPAAYAWFQPFSGPLGVFLGVLTIAIFALLGISTVIDISFLTIPGMQWLLISKTSNNSKPPFVSIEAWTSYQEALQTHGQVLTIFFRKKSGQMIVLGICVLYLVSGNLFALVAKVVDYFQGLVQTFTQ